MKVLVPRAALESACREFERNLDSVMAEAIWWKRWKQTIQDKVRFSLGVIRRRWEAGQ